MNLEKNFKLEKAMELETIATELEKSWWENIQI